MNIGFSPGGFEQRQGGVSRYFSELLAGLLVLGQHVQLLGPPLPNHHLAAVGFGQSPSHRRTGQAQVRAIYTEIAERFVGLSPALSSLDVFHETFYPPLRLKQPPGIPRVVTVHDMIHEIFPHHFRKWPPVAKRKLRAVKEADAVITVSQNTKNDLLDLINIAEDRVTVIPLGVHQIPRGELLSTDTRKAAFLYVGRRDKYKNFGLLIEAFGLFRKKVEPSCRLVLVGGGDLRANERQDLARHGVSQDAVVVVAGRDAELEHWYRNARALVFPSVYEGFGLPPLEAMARGCPVIASWSSSIPEVVGEAGHLFDPTSVRSLLDQMVSVSENSRQTLARVNEGLSRAGEMSWDKTAQKTLRVYERVQLR